MGPGSISAMREPAGDATQSRTLDPKIQIRNFGQVVEPEAMCTKQHRGRGSVIRLSYAKWIVAEEICSLGDS